MEIREALAKAHETVSSSTPAPEPAETTSTPAPETAAAPDTTPAAVAPSPAASARVRDEHGRFAPKPGDEPAEKVAAAPKAGANGAAASAPPATEAKPGAGLPTSSPAPGEAVTPKPAEPAHKPPQSWRADEREEFAKAPPKVQAAVLRREREIQTKLNEVAQTTRAAEEFHRVAAPWEPMFRSQGVTPTQAFDNLARTYYALQTAPLPQRAQIVASVIQQAGIPVELLAQALDGQPATAQAQPHVDPAAIAQQAEARIMQRLQAQAAQVQQRQNMTRLERFAQSHEFYDDVRDRMADILAARGQANPSDKELDEVYDLACRVHPGIAPVLEQRRAAKAAPSAQASTAAIQAAASSVRSTPAAPPQRAAQPGSSIRSAMQAAREQLERQGR